MNNISTISWLAFSIAFFVFAVMLGYSAVMDINKKNIEPAKINELILYQYATPIRVTVNEKENLWDFIEDEKPQVGKKYCLRLKAVSIVTNLGTEKSKTYDFVIVPIEGVQ